MAELIDNSIDANASQIQIVEIHVPDSSYLLVMDNGHGIDDFRKFATYASSKDERRKRDQAQMTHIPDTSSSSPTKRQKTNEGNPVSSSSSRQDYNSVQSDSLGVYGVGAKDACSYLGVQMRVLTKSTTGGIRMLRFNDQDGHKSTEISFASIEALTNYLQDPGNILTTSSASVVIPKIVEHFGSCSTCTIILTKLRSEIVAFLRDEEAGIESKIATYYHFYLHPNGTKSLDFVHT